MRKMIAYCGLDCEKCDAYLATLHDDQALREKTAKAWTEINHVPILPEHIVVPTGSKRCSVTAFVRFASVR